MMDGEKLEMGIMEEQERLGKKIAGGAGRLGKGLFRAGETD